jgi:hypothetical protein
VRFIQLSASCNHAGIRRQYSHTTLEASAVEVMALIKLEQVGQQPYQGALAGGRIPLEDV